MAYRVIKKGYTLLFSRIHNFPTDTFPNNHSKFSGKLNPESVKYLYHEIHSVFMIGGGRNSAMSVWEDVKGASFSK
ncbi:hypothetical protein MTBBW1_1790014 [Desulfamplus magnetovallimortis]|uniref:Uncharacterized protein n=1 Tax=Desulfamplus magnetovallimortis TaxID=1246637 RepID=A0A1W1HAC9_9BACT|nr:hypothetical protein MTBBW1_1790014 [Desulfamplus magnetovallimortis]